MVPPGNECRNRPENMNKSSVSCPCDKLKPGLGCWSLEETISKIRNAARRLQEEQTVPNTSFSKEELRLQEEIGRGSFARVYRGRYFEDIVAVKIFNELDDNISAGNKRLEDEIEREARIIEQKRSKYIVRLLHYSREEKWIVTEYCANGSLFDVMRNAMKREIVEDWKYRLKWMYQVALGMHIIHDQPPTILHRDLKPSNIFLDQNFDAKVGDFGMSKQMRGGPAIPSVSSGQHLRMLWQPLEVINSRGYSTKSDVYSFGIVMHEVMMLKAPYGFDSTVNALDARVYSHVQEGGGLRIPQNRSLILGTWDTCLEEYITLMLQCVEANPENRPAFREISQKLRTIKENYEAFAERQQKKETGTNYSTKSIVVKIIMLLLLVCGSIDIIMIIIHLIKGHHHKHEFEHLSILAVTILILILLFALLILHFWSSIELKWSKRKQIVSERTISFSQPHNIKQRLVPSPRDRIYLIGQSPFANGPDSSGSKSDNSGSHSLPHGDLYREICQRFLAEFHSDGSPAFMGPILDFCHRHRDTQINQLEWETFRRLLRAHSAVKTTETWRAYKNHLEHPPPLSLSRRLRPPKAQSEKLLGLKTFDEQSSKLLQSDHILAKSAPLLNELHEISLAKIIDGTLPIMRTSSTGQLSQESKQSRRLYGNVLHTLEESPAANYDPSSLSEKCCDVEIV